MAAVDVFKPDYPIADAISLGALSKCDIPIVKRIISRHMGTQQQLALDIWFEDEYVHSFSWRVLDILLFSWFIRHCDGTRNGSTLTLSLSLPVKDVTMTLQQIELMECSLLHVLFPLNMAIGKGRWLNRDER